MITRLRLINYRNHRDTTITLEPLTVFIGPVASGKSNVFNALGQLAALVRREPADAFGQGGLSFESVRYRGAGPDEPLGFEVHVRYEAHGSVLVDDRYELRLAQDGERTYRVERERFESANAPWLERGAEGRVRWPGGDVQSLSPHDPPCIHEAWRTSEDAVSGTWEATRPAAETRAPDARFRDLETVAGLLAHQRRFRLLPEVIAAPCSERNVPLLEPDGAGMADVLARLKTGRGVEYSRLLAVLKRFEPRVQEITLTPVSGDLITWGLRFESGDTFWAEELSDGTLLAAGLAALSVLPRPALRLCVEEPETGVHPRLLRDILDVFVELAYPSDDDPPVQVLLSTHSPYLLDHFKDMPECVRVFDLEDGVSKVTPLVDRLAERGTTMSDLGGPLGEAWYTGLLGGV